MEETEDGRTKGNKIQLGKIFKGTMNQAPMKIRVSSIPSKIENIIYNQQGKPAFGDSRERFYTNYQQKINQTPGPGNYLSTNNNEKISSKKGSGIFASESKLNRLQKVLNHNPGPGAYKINHNQIQKHTKSLSTASLSSKIQAHQLFKNQIQNSKAIPGPGKYSQNTAIKSHSLTNFTFKSKNNRFFNHQNTNPPVGSYNLHFTNSVKAHKFIEQKQKMETKNEKYMEQISGKMKLQNEIGPGSYNVSVNQKKHTFQIKQTIYDRFGIIREGFQPNRVTYNHSEEQVLTGEQTKTDKNLRNKGITSMFKSKVKRYEFGEDRKDIPTEPCRYSPLKTDKKSHLINFDLKWV